MTDSEMDLTILLQQRDKEIAGLKASLRSTRAQHTADLASIAAAANDLVAFVKGTAHDGTAADIVSAATELAVLVAAAADSAADQSAIVEHDVDDVVVVEAVEHRDIATEAAEGHEAAAPAESENDHGEARQGE